MQKSRYTDTQIINILKQAEAGTPVPELCREHGMSSAKFYKWRVKDGGMVPLRSSYGSAAAYHRSAQPAPHARAWRYRSPLRLPPM